MTLGLVALLNYVRGLARVLQVAVDLSQLASFVLETLTSLMGPRITPTCLELNCPVKLPSLATN